MFNENTLSLLRERLAAYLCDDHAEAKEYNKFNCVCGSSDALHYYPEDNTWHCYSCDHGGDLFALYAYDTDRDPQRDFVQIVKELASRFGVALEDAAAPTTAKPGADHAQQYQRGKADAPTREQEQRWERAFERQERERETQTFCNAAAITLQAMAEPEAEQVGSYLNSRCVSRATAAKFGLGAAVLHGKTALIIPNSKGYNARIIDPGEGQAKYYRAGSVQLLEALQPTDQEHQQPCWIVEGELNALSIWQAGGCAIATGGAQNVKQAIEYAKENRDKFSAFVIFYDADKAGSTHGKTILDALQNAGIRCYAWPRADGDTRDANDILKDDRTQEGIYSGELVRMVDKARRQGALTADILAHLQQLDGEAAFNSALAHIQEGRYTRCYPTPFPQLNSALFGGLHPGLVILGATTGAGKTTYALQLASWIAEQGTRVLYVSLEMAAVELYTRILSRLAGYVTALGLRTCFDHLQSKPCVLNAIDRFRNRIAPRFNIVEGVGNFSANEAAELASYYKQLDGAPPVVVVDYLQMLASPNPRLTDKQAIDKSILTLKRLSRDLGALVIAISSYNRGSYNTEANLSAFKESGSIEYTADLVLSLDAKPDAEQVNTETRDVTLNCLKNRDGKRFKLSYSYTPAYNLFEEETDTYRSYEAPRRVF